MGLYWEWGLVDGNPRKISLGTRYATVVRWAA